MINELSGLENKVYTYKITNKPKQAILKVKL